MFIRLMPRAIVLATALAAIAPSNAAEAARERQFDFENAAVQTLPDGFRTGMTGRWKSTEWRVRRIEGNRVLAHIGFWNEDPDGVFPVCWVAGSHARDLILTVRLYPVTPPAGIAGAVHDGAGIVVRFKDPDNYYLLRAVPLETRVRLYKVVDGVRTTLAGKDIVVATGEWHRLALEVRGSRFKAYLDGAALFEHEDHTFPDGGAYGLWSKPNNVTYFDDLRAAILDRSGG